MPDARFKISAATSANPMRISIVQGPFLPVPPIMGGAVEKVWFSLGQEFAYQGHQVHHLSRAHPQLPKRENIEGVTHRRVSGFSSPTTHARRLLRDFWFGLRLLPLLPPADILVTNTFWLPFLARRKSRGIPYVHVARYPKGQLKLYRHCILQTVSAPIREAILAEDPSAAARTRVIPYPLSEKYLTPVLGSATRNLLFTGRVHPEKGIHHLIEAFGLLPSHVRATWKLQIVGPHETQFGGGGDAYLVQLRDLANRTGHLDRIDFVGRVFDETRLTALYRNASVFVYPSLAEKGETFGLAALEGMAAGCAPIVSSLPCFGDFIRHNQNGLIYNHRDAHPPAQLAAALLTLIENPSQLATLRHAAWTTARDYTLTKVGRLFLDDFQSLLE